MRVLAVIVLLLAAPAARGESAWVRSPGGPAYFAVDVADVDSAIDWYTTAFDVSAIDDTTTADGRVRIANLLGDGIAIELIRDARGAPAESRPGGRGLRKVGVSVDDVRIVADRVAASGGERPRVVEITRQGIRLIQLQDPEGNTIQLHSPLDPRTDDREELLRLHREVLRAHRDNDLDAWLGDEAEEYVQANRGEISHPSIEERRARLQPYLDATTFTEYRDLVEPLVQVSDDGSLGWVICRVRASGSAGGEAFSSTWAWIELYAKRDGVWKRIGNVSNRQE